MPDIAQVIITALSVSLIMTFRHVVDLKGRFSYHPLPIEVYEPSLVVITEPENYDDDEEDEEMDLWIDSDEEWFQNFSEKAQREHELKLMKLHEEASEKNE